jgi:hypothetical protein
MGNDRNPGQGPLDPIEEAPAKGIQTPPEKNQKTLDKFAQKNQWHTPTYQGGSP